MMPETNDIILTRDVCRNCGTGSVIYPIKFKALPLAGTYLTAQELGSEPELPMSVGICESCSLVQLKEVVQPSIYNLYRLVGTVSQGYRNHLRILSTDLVERWGVTGKRVVEIGSSDGYLLKDIRDRGGNEVFGYEPSNALRAACQEDGLSVSGSFFGPETTGDLPFANADTVVMRHVLEHIDDIDGFIGAAEDILTPDGLLVIEVPDLDSILNNEHFFHFYHEHLTYFTLDTLSRLVRRHGFGVVEHTIVDIHGGSLLVYCRREAGRDNLNDKVSVDAGQRFTAFAGGMKTYLDSLNEFVNVVNTSGSRMAGYGAAQRTANACGMADLGPEQIDYLVDKSEYLRGHYTPGSHLLIDTPERLRPEDPGILLLFAPSHEQEVMREQSEWSASGGRFVSLHPTPRFIQ